MNYRHTVATAALLFTGVAPAASAAGGPSHVTGAGAPYFNAALRVMAAAHNVYVRARILTQAQPAGGQRISQGGSLEVAWKPGGKFYLRSFGAGGDGLLVGNGKTVYKYDPKTNVYSKQSSADILSGAMIVRSRVGILLGPGARQWSYAGTRSVAGRSCDLIMSEGATPNQAIYLDRSTHLPYHVTVWGSTARGSATYDVHFLDFAINRTISDAFFHFTPPKGARRR